MYPLHILLVWSLLLCTIGIPGQALDSNTSLATPDEKHLSRHKRLIYYSSENRLVLPPGAAAYVTLSLALPFWRNAPLGYGSEMDISIPVSFNFDDLGMTSAENPWGLFPEFFRKKREAWAPIEGVNWAGGDREMVFQVAEDYLNMFGMPGKPCLLRAICEIFETPLLKHGLFGEILQLVLSVSNSVAAAERLADYLEAEKLGKKKKSCEKYYAGCKKSFFTHNAQRMKDPSNNEIFERKQHIKRKLSKEESEQRQKAMFEKAKELMEREREIKEMKYGNEL